MREIKFRAWDKEDKRMIVDEQEFIPLKVTNKGVLKLSPFHKENLWEISDAKRFELMQYTGFKDKNAKEIYEGDIIRWHDIETFDYLITYTDGVFCLNEMPDSNFWHHREIISERWEVIGNIYKNPELLNS